MTEELNVNGDTINHMANYGFVKEWLRYGEIHVLAEKHHISRQTAYKILRGQSKNYEFLKACYETAYERAMTFKRLNEKMSSI